MEDVTLIQKNKQKIVKYMKQKRNVQNVNKVIF